MTGFEYPYLGLLLFLPFLMQFFLKNDAKNNTAIRIPFLGDMKNVAQKIASNRFVGVSGMKRFSRLQMFFLSVWTLLVLSLMRPVTTTGPIRPEHTGRDILLITDISTSMLENDFVFNTKRVTRLDAVRAVVSDFVTKRANDRLGLILFGTRAYLQAPLTFDRQAVLDILDSMRAGMAGQSTSIGDALALGLKALKESGRDKKNQIIILLTDGENNDGQMSFPKAIALAKSEGVKVYTIGAGAPTFSLASAFFNIQNQDLDEESLKKLAQETKGQYFRATSLKDLIDVYRQIDALEADNYQEQQMFIKKELYFWPLLFAFLLSLFALTAAFQAERKDA